VSSCFSFETDQKKAVLAQRLLAGSLYKDQMKNKKRGGGHVRPLSRGVGGHWSSKIKICGQKS